MDVHLYRIERPASAANRSRYQRQRLAFFFSGLKASLSSRSSDDQHLYDRASRADQRWCTRGERSCDIAGQTSLHHVHSSDTPIICHPGSKLRHYRRPSQLPSFNPIVPILQCYSGWGAICLQLIGVGSIGTGIGTRLWSQSIHIGQ